MIEVKHLREFSVKKEKNALFNVLLDENPQLEKLLRDSSGYAEFENKLAELSWSILENSPNAYSYFKTSDQKFYNQLNWEDFGAIRILDYINNSNIEIVDPNLRGKTIRNEPFRLLWRAFKNKDQNTNSDFWEDMILLFRQLSGKLKRRLPSREMLDEWMSHFPSGLNPDIMELHKKNKERIIEGIIKKIEGKTKKHSRYFFPENTSDIQKKELVGKWWGETKFHFYFAVRDPEELNLMLDNSLEPETMETLRKAKEVGIPFFINPYYLSLLLVDAYEYIGADQAIRDYVLYTKELIDEFGYIVAWEKEDIVQPGKPNAAGWILPSKNIHRRYPEVSILIPETVGRACGGLCSSCQRMYDFQSGNLNFEFEKLEPKGTWPEKLNKLMGYFEEDSQLRDILITGGDALMNSDKSLKNIFDEVYEMALKKVNNNKLRQDGEKYAEMLRVRLGSRLLAYLPQRITDSLVGILKDFKEKASKIGIKQFVIQTHFESPLEITLEAKQAVQKILSAGWIITNQLVYTTAASMRGHTAKLRKDLNDIGVLPYYTFSVKGFMENSHNFATNARAVQEQQEEKIFGVIDEGYYGTIKKFPLDAQNMVQNIDKIRNKENLPFLATDRNVLNMPGVGKSMTFRTIGITEDGRRILEFDHDHNRTHSPIIEQMDKVRIIESKSISSYLRQLDGMGEDIADYETVYGYSIGQTENRMPVYEYPEYEFKLTTKFTNFGITNLS